MSTQPTTKVVPTAAASAAAAATKMEVRRERTFSLRSHRISLLDIIGILHAERATGTLSIDFSQGGVGTIRFEEKTKIDI